MIAALAGVAFDARIATREVEGLLGRAAAARWIAANALAVTGRRVWLVGTPPAAPRVFALRAGCLASVIAAIASVPVLIDASLLPRHWRLALRALGLPELECTTAEALAGGASVLSSDELGASSLSVDALPRGFRVRLGAVRHMLRA